MIDVILAIASKLMIKMTWYDDKTIFLDVVFIMM